MSSRNKFLLENSGETKMSKRMSTGNYSSVYFFKIFFRVCGVWFDGRRIRFPVSGTHFSIFFGKLKRLNETQGFVHRAANWEVVDSDLTHSSRRINNEQASGRNMMKKTVVDGNP